MKKTKVIVKQSSDKSLEVPLEVMAQSIVEIAAVGKQLKNSRLSEKAILVLLKHYTGEMETTIKKVLDGISNLEAAYLRR